MCWFKKKEEPKKEVKIEPVYYYVTTSLAVDLSDINALNKAFTDGFYMNQYQQTSILPTVGIIVLTKTVEVLRTK